jgi:hypothetical protein
VLSEHCRTMYREGMTRKKRQTAPEIVTVRGWPDLNRGPYVLKLRWRVVRGRMECVGVELRTYSDDAEDGELRRTWRGPRADDAEPVTTDVWRSVALGAVVDGERRAMLKQVEVAELLGASWAAEVRADWTPRPRRGRQLGRGEHERVAEVYLDALRRHENPTQRVADVYGLTYPAAAKRVQRARAAGHLPATLQGRAGGLTDQTGDAPRQKGKS